MIALVFICRKFLPAPIIQDIRADFEKMPEYATDNMTNVKCARIIASEKVKIS